MANKRMVLTLFVVMVAVPAVSFVIGNKLGAWLMADAK